MGITDWKQAAGGPVTEFSTEKLDPSEEFVLELIDSDYQENVALKFHDETQITDRFKTVWQVVGHTTKVWCYFNLPLGYLKGTAGPSEKSNVVKFAKRFRAVPIGSAFRLADVFTDHMRIRARLKKQEKSEYYNIDLDTIGPYFPDKVAPSPQETDTALLKNFLAKYNNQDEALKAYKELMPGEDESRFWLTWALVVKEREGVKKP